MGRWHLRRRRRRDEDFILRYPFPEQIETRCRHHRPDLSDRDWQLAERGLREWFLCCAWRDGEVLGMPSRLVDEAWHEFILDSTAYTEFCERAFGEYLHHSPEETMSTPMAGALDRTVRSWDHSAAGRGAESVLWGLDALVGIADPLGLSDGDVERAREEESPESGAGAWVPIGGDGGGHHHHGSSEAGSVGGESAGEATGGDGGGGGGDSGGGGGDSGGGGGDSGGGGCGGGGCGGGN